MIAAHKNVRVLLSLLKQYDVRHIGELNKAMQELVQPSDRSIVVEVFVDKEEDVQGLHHLQHG